MIQRYNFFLRQLKLVVAFERFSHVHLLIISYLLHMHWFNSCVQCKWWQLFWYTSFNSPFYICVPNFHEKNGRKFGGESCQMLSCIYWNCIGLAWSLLFYIIATTHISSSLFVDFRISSACIVFYHKNIFCNSYWQVSCSCRQGKSAVCSHFG